MLTGSEARGVPNNLWFRIPNRGAIVELEQRLAAEVAFGSCRAGSPGGMDKDQEIQLGQIWF
jgi:hypothetical protein